MERSPLTFSKDERLKNKIEIDALFKDGAAFFVFPFKVIYSIVDVEEVQPARVVFSVPKRSFKRAVVRNLIRRRAEEAYRLHKAELNDYLQENQLSLNVMFIYADQQILEYKRIEKGMKKVFQKFFSQ